MGTSLISRNRTRFPQGYTIVAHHGGIELGILKLDSGESFRHEDLARESAWILVSGNVEVRTLKGAHEFARASVFDERPWVVHLPATEHLELRARGGGAEFAVAKTTNERPFAVGIWGPSDVSTEYRGKGLAQDASLRQVRSVFDLTNRPDSNLVVGEVVNYPGRWSSYPPHHHEQPEIYHYRFTEPQGYGHAELDDDVYKIRDGDTLCIDGGKDHAQVSAPGYGMYYLWVVRHLPDNPYRGFEFSEEHRWMLDPKHQGWTPK